VLKPEPQVKKFGEPDLNLHPEEQLPKISLVSKLGLEVLFRTDQHSLAQPNSMQFQGCDIDVNAFRITKSLQEVSNFSGSKGRKNQ
jgi:hypothetical protein